MLGALLGFCGRAASADSTAGGLRGLDTELRSTGRIGTYTPSPVGEIEPASPAKERAPRKLKMPDPDRGERPAPAPRSGGLAEEEFLQTETPVTGCRVEIARRRQVSPEKVAAKEVVLRFNVEADGHVRDAEAVSAPQTDLELAACAKRVLSQWVFAKHGGEAITVERTYRFR